ncbi:MAG: DNA polymerase III subunit delta', partial [Halomonas sp.]|nr:DNA polymerase III subunit delta' [Halomonas sp.]
EQLVRGGEPVSEAARLDRQAIDTILWYGIAWLEDLIRLGLSGSTSSLRNPDLLPLYRQAVKNARVRDWFKLLDYAREQRRLLAVGANPNPQLVLEAWLVRWSALLRS